ncbi:telomere length regulation protein [Neophaeococcomyces mojaviensis]|uniref:Telomere length regulation protein n=1 Tax=Neophaeococcomyces mojaviensis TaxID=3383035 RepID=A0ACC3AHE9_9EURO|nr:telomere length regulation protein [Knufia sp. JES_112]
MATSKSIAPFFETLLRPSKLSYSQYICTPCLRQQQSIRQQEQKRSLHRSVKPLPIPKPTPFVPDVPTFLTLIGRGLSAHASKFESWDKLFTLSSPELKELGIEPARTRRYLLRWRQKFRRGEYGVGGDLNHVKDGVGELRVIEVPSLPSQTASDTNVASPSSSGYVSTTSTPGMTKLILNVPVGSSSYVLDAGQTTRDLKKPKDFTLKNGHVISGPYSQAVKGTNGSAVRIQVVEGMWEDRLGKKVFGGERRRAEVLHKMAVAEHRKNVK